MSIVERVEPGHWRVLTDGGCWWTCYQERAWLPWRILFWEDDRWHRCRQLATLEGCFDMIEAISER